jgi:hypothetical protein
MAKGPQGWVQCEDHLPYYNKDNSCSLPRLHDHDTTTREDLGGGTPGSRPRLSGALGASMQHEGTVPDSFVQNKTTRIASLGQSTKHFELLARRGGKWCLNFAV